MAMTNAERQAKWRASLKAKAASSERFEDALRAIIKERLSDLSRRLEGQGEDPLPHEIIVACDALNDEDLGTFFDEWAEGLYEIVWRRSEMEKAAARRKEKGSRAAAKKATKAKAVSNV